MLEQSQPISGYLGLLSARGDILGSAVGHVPGSPKGSFCEGSVHGSLMYQHAAQPLP